jgi:hypothetical protein
MPLPKPLSRPPSLLERGIRPSSSLPALASEAPPTMKRAEPVLRSDRALRQMSLPFFAPLDLRTR